MKFDVKIFGKVRGVPRVLLAAMVALLVSISANAADDIINARYVTGMEMPVSGAGFTATGKRVDLTLNFAPAKGTDLVLVHNTGPNFIAGTFDNLQHGQIVTLSYLGVAYHFVANYYGGNGRDLVLMGITLDDLSAATLAKLDDALVLALKKSRGEAPFERSRSFQPEDYERGGRVLVDVKGSVSTELVNEVARLGGDVFNNSQTAATLRAWVPFTALEAVANLKAVESMAAARPTMTHRLTPN